jgi:hypothetical protein
MPTFEVTVKFIVEAASAQDAPDAVHDKIIEGNMPDPVSIDQIED